MRSSRHRCDATAAAGFGQPPRRAPAVRAATLLAPAFVAVFLAAGCGDPVGDQRGGFPVDPAPVLGLWVEREPTASPPREAFIEAGAGFLAGQFEFERSDLEFRVPFNDGHWDGERIAFTTADVFGLGGGRISWTALLILPTEDIPTRLRFFPMVGGGIPFSIEYVRP